MPLMGMCKMAKRDSDMNIEPSEIWCPSRPTTENVAAVTIAGEAVQKLFEGTPVRYN